jgi:GT2 family glycosyltransferase
VADRRYLLGVLVYNGMGVVERCLESAARIAGPNVDVVVYDDCSPAEGWSRAVKEMCAILGIGYYRSPRNLGIPRNMSLVMKSGVELGYDVVGLINSDVVLPSNLIAAMDAVFDSATDIASITPWSNNVSVFSLPMGDATGALSGAAFVDRLSSALAGSTGGRTIDIPTGVGYCMMLDVRAIASVGLMDPIFGRGYCEEVDWCQRAVIAGRRQVLALGAYVFHEGGGTNRDEGLLAHGNTTVAEHEAIIRLRYPDYVDRVERFLASANLPELGRTELGHAFTALARSNGYRLQIGSGIASNEQVIVALPPNDPHGPAVLSLNGIKTSVEPGAELHWDEYTVLERFGRPTSVVALEPGTVRQAFVDYAVREGTPLEQQMLYPFGVVGRVPGVVDLLGP